MWRKNLTCIALLLLLFFSLGIITESLAMASPIREWNFDEGSGQMTKERILNKTGIFSGVLEWVTGVRNTALKFASQADYVQTDPVLGSLSKWSFTAYVKPTGTGECRVYSEKDANDQCYFYISITSANQLEVAVKNGNNYVKHVTTAGSNLKIERNKWNHITVTYSGSQVEMNKVTAQIKCYRERKLMGEGTINFAPSLNFGAYIYGASWAGTEETRLDRLELAKGLGSGDDFDNIYPWSEMKPATINGQAVVKLSKFYYRHECDGVEHKFYISGVELPGYKLHPAFRKSNYVYVGRNKFGANTTRAQCRDTAKGYGSGWGLIDLPTWSAIQMLWLVEYADTNSENYSTNWRNLNGLWTRPGQWIDGVNIKDWRVYLSENNAGFQDDVFSGDYKDTGFVLPSGNGYITNWHYSATYDWSFIPSYVGGSSSTYISDYLYSNSGNRVLSCGYYSPAGTAGLFFWFANNSSSSADSYHAARALYIP